MRFEISIIVFVIILLLALIIASSCVMIETNKKYVHCISACPDHGVGRCIANCYADKPYPRPEVE